MSLVEIPGKTWVGHARDQRWSRPFCLVVSIGYAAPVQKTCTAVRAGRAVRQSHSSVHQQTMRPLNRVGKERQGRDCDG